MKSLDRIVRMVEDETCPIRRLRMLREIKELDDRLRLIRR